MHQPKVYLPLPRRAEPRLWEDLSSLICRTARKMGYENPKWILQPAEGGYSIREAHLPILSAREDYHLLEQLLLLERDTIYNMTLHSFASRVPGTAVSTSVSSSQYVVIHRPRITHDVLARYFLNRSCIRVCPACLQEDEGYDRHYWRMQFAFLCPHHRLPLRARCPICNAPIRPLRPHLWLCPSCKQGDYRLSVLSPFNEESILYLGQLLFLHACGVTLSEGEAVTEQRVMSQLAGLPSDQYFQLFQKVLFSFVENFSWKELMLMNISLGVLAPEEITGNQEDVFSASAAAFLLFHTIFADWPRQFFAFLALLYQISQPPFSGERKTDTVSYCQELFYDPWLSEEYTWLRDSYTHHLQQFHRDQQTIRQTREQVNEREYQWSTRGNKTTSQVSGIDQYYEHSLPILFPTKITPHPWESLASVLSRAAKKMNAVHPDDLLHPAFTRSRTTIKQLMDLPLHRHFPVLEYLLQLQSETIYHLTCHHFAPCFQTKPQQTNFGEERFLTHGLSFFRNQETAWVCSRCLLEEDEAYDRLYWNIAGVTICHTHNLLLVNVCPKCGRNIPVIRPEVVKCPFCKRGDYRTVVHLGINEESIFSIVSRLLLHYLNVSSFQMREVPLSLIHSPLLNMKSSHYFHLILTLIEDFIAEYPQDSLIETLRVLLSPNEQNISLHKDFLSDTYTIKIILSHVILTEWPTRFFAFLDLLYLMTAQHPYQSVGHKIAQWRKRLWKKFRPQTFSWLLDTFDSYTQHVYESKWYLKFQEQEEQKAWASEVFQEVWNLTKD